MKVLWDEKFNSLESKVPAEDFVSELRKIDGYPFGEEFSAEQVVELAKNNDSVLHKLFVWDDEVAAKHYRELQAKILLRKIKYIEDKYSKSKNYYQTT